MSAPSLAGKRAVVTGASGDIGSAVAVALAGAGADVACVGRRPESLDKVCAAVEEAGARGLAIPTDVTDEAGVESMVSAIDEQWGGVDIVVNNAGGARFLSPLADLGRRGWDKTVALNLTAPYLVARAAARGMAERGHGVVINIGSLTGLRAQNGMAHYSAAKAGLDMLTRSMCLEWAADGIRVNSVVPGLIRTQAWEHYSGDDAMSELLDQQIPLGRWGAPADIAEPVVFLCGPGASFVTGATLLVDGGALA